MAQSDAARIAQLEADTASTSCKLDAALATLETSERSAEQKEKYTKEQRVRIEELLQQMLQTKRELHIAQQARDDLSNRLEQQRTEALAAQEELAGALQRVDEATARGETLVEQLAQQHEVVRDGAAAAKRCEGLENELQEMSSQLARTNSQLKRATSLQSSARSDTVHWPAQASSHVC